MEMARHLPISISDWRNSRQSFLKLASSKADYEDVADEIYRLREEKQKVQLENVGRDELKKRISDMGDFLWEQPTSIAEYDELLIRRLIEKSHCLRGKVYRGIQVRRDCGC